MFHLTEEKSRLRLHIHRFIEKDDLARIEEEVDAVIGSRDPEGLELIAEIDGGEGLISETFSGLVPSLRKKGICDIKIKN